MAIDITGADAYFGATNHVLAAEWAQFTSTNLRTAAVAQARRMIADVVDELDTDATTEGDFPRHDVACYELALHLLLNGPALGDGDVSAPHILSTKEDGSKKEQLSMDTIPACAMRWLVRTGYVRLGRFEALE